MIAKEEIRNFNHIQMVKRVNEIVCNLIIENMKAGSSFEKAKDQAYNRLEKDHPAVLEFWLTHYKPR